MSQPIFADDRHWPAIYGQLTDWIRRQGGYVHPQLQLNVATGDATERTLVSGGGIERYTTLVKLPKTICLNEDTAFERHKSAAAVAAVWLTALDECSVFPQLNRGAARILALLYHVSLMARGAASPFAPYLESLPSHKEVALHPLWRAGVPGVLEQVAAYCPYAGRQLLAMDRDVVELRERLAELEACEGSLLGPDMVVDDWVRWGAIMVMTRQWGEDGFLPVVDLFQHASGARSFTEDHRGGTQVAFFVEDEYGAGDEVFNNYGKHDSMTMLLGYGFYDPAWSVPMIEVSPDLLAGSLVGAMVCRDLGSVLPSTQPPEPLFYLDAQGPSRGLGLYLDAMAFHRQTEPQLGTPQHTALRAAALEEIVADLRRERRLVEEVVGEGDWLRGMVTAVVRDQSAILEMERE